MHTWEATYRIKCKISNKEKTMIFYVTAKTIADVPAAIRSQGFIQKNVSVEEVSIKKITTSMVILGKHVEGEIF